MRAIDDSQGLGSVTMLSRASMATRRQSRFLQRAGGGLSGLGGPIWQWPSAISSLSCSELNSTVDRLSQALGQARARNLTDRPGYKAALTFYERETSLNPFTRSDPWTSASCSRIVAEGEAALAQLNSELTSVGAPPVYVAPPPSPDNPSKGPGFFETVKTVAIAGAVIAGVVVVAPIVWEVVASHRAGRKAR